MLAHPAGNLTAAHPQSALASGPHFQSLYKLHSRWQQDIDHIWTLIFCCFVFGLAKCFIFPKRKQKRNRKGDWVTDNGMLTEEETNKQKHWRSPYQKRGEDYLRQIAADAWLGLSCWVFQKANPKAHFLWGQDESVGLVFSSVSKYWARERKTREPKTRWVKRMEEVFNRPFDAMKNLWDYKECEVLSFILCCSHIRVLKRN